MKNIQSMRCTGTLALSYTTCCYSATAHFPCLPGEEVSNFVTCFALHLLDCQGAPQMWTIYPEPKGNICPLQSGNVLCLRKFQRISAFLLPPSTRLTLLRRHNCGLTTACCPEIFDPRLEFLVPRRMVSAARPLKPAYRVGSLTM